MFSALSILFLVFSLGMAQSTNLCLKGCSGPNPTCICISWLSECVDDDYTGHCVISNRGIAVAATAAFVILFIFGLICCCCCCGFPAMVAFCCCRPREPEVLIVNSRMEYPQHGQQQYVYEQTPQYQGY